MTASAAPPLQDARMFLDSLYPALYRGPAEVLGDGKAAPNDFTTMFPKLGPFTMTDLLTFAGVA